MLKGRFSAMACPCEVLLDTGDRALADELTALAAGEARRVEAKFSRYCSTSAVSRLNAEAGRPTEVDEETARLLDYAARCHALSGGLFDVTTGVLRRAWTFDKGARFPSQAEVEAARALVGWDKVVWEKGVLTLRPGMELDLGGIGKEYAVDRTLSLISARGVAALVNFGGDAAASPRPSGAPWTVGIERVDEEGAASRVIHMTKGALATSGDARRHIVHDGKRYGHVLDPRSGRPVEDSPRSVTVAAGTCSEAGFLSTTALLKGREAEPFLEGAASRFWVTRESQRLCRLRR